jgi:hypothetical protein
VTVRKHRIQQILIVFEKLANVLADARLLLPAEYFTDFGICFDETVIIETDDSDAVACLFKECAVTLLTRTQLALLTPHESEQQGDDERVDGKGNEDVFSALFNVPTSLRVGLSGVFPVHPGKERRAQRFLPNEDHHNSQRYGENNEEHYYL